MSRSDEQWTKLPLAAVPERLSFVPNNAERDTFEASWREVVAFDLDQVSRIMRHDGVKISQRSLLKYVRSTGWTGRLVLRNRVSIIGMYLAEHLTFNHYNDVKFFWVHPDYYEHTVALRLLQLARLELPEHPTRVSVNAEATTLHALMKESGWTDGSDFSSDAELPAGRRLFYARSAAGLEYRAALEAGRATRQPAAGNDAGRRGERRGDHAH